MKEVTVIVINPETGTVVQGNHRARAFARIMSAPPVDPPPTPKPAPEPPPPTEPEPEEEERK